MANPKTISAVSLWIFAIVAIGLTSCSKPFVDAKISRDVAPLSRSYAASPNEAYYAARWALENCGYSVSTENLQDGEVTTTWTPVKSSSHYIDLFDRPDYGVTNSYHQLQINIIPEGGRTTVSVASRIKTLVKNLKSAGIEERKVLDKMGDYLRKAEPTLTNLGINE